MAVVPRRVGRGSNLTVRTPLWGSMSPLPVSAQGSGHGDGCEVAGRRLTCMFIVGLVMLPHVKMPAYASSLPHEWMPAWVVVV
jgi:hypothetical protein